jgi:methylmalonyl-CoA/ethylmalonyl-CoA epimerase
MRLHHVGIAVRDLDQAVDYYERSLGAEIMAQGEREGLKFALLDLGGVEIELLATEDPRLRAGAFLAARGVGLYHLAYAVKNIEAETARLVREGLRQSGDVKTGVHDAPIVFFEPSGIDGVLTELIQVDEPGTDQSMTGGRASQARVTTGAGAVAQSPRWRRFIRIVLEWLSVVRGSAP